MSPYLDWLCRGVLAVVFLISAGSKVRGRPAFADFRRATEQLSGTTGYPAAALAALVLGCETVVVFGLLDDRAAPYAFGLAAALLGAFTAALLGKLRSGTPVVCRCLGSATSATYTSIARNAVLIGVALCGLAGTVVHGASARLPAEGVLVCAGGAVVLAVGLVRLDWIVEALTGYR